MAKLRIKHTEIEVEGTPAELADSIVAALNQVAQGGRVTKRSVTAISSTSGQKKTANTQSELSLPFATDAEPAADDSSNGTTVKS